MKKIFVTAVLLFAPIVAYSAQQTWSNGDSLSSIRTKILANDSDLYSQAATHWVQSGHTYTADIDNVTHGGKTYICTVTHNSSDAGVAGNEPGVGGNWQDVWEVSGNGIFEPAQTAASQVEAEAGTESALRSFSPLRIKQAIDALGGSMTWPTAAGIPYWTSGTSWGGSYTLDTDLSSVSTSDNSIPSAKAVDAAYQKKTAMEYVDVDGTTIGKVSGTGELATPWLLGVKSGVYLGASAKAADSDLLDNHDTSYFQVALTNPVVQANFGTGVYTFLGNPSIANFFAALTGEGAFAATLLGYTDASAVRAGIGAQAALTIISGTKALLTTSLAANTCRTETVTATGAASTDVVSGNFNASPDGVSGYGAAAVDGMKIYAVPITNTINFIVCNGTAAAITPGARTLNWQIIK